MKKNKYVLITGASGGIGWELAHVFAREGYDLVLVARTEKKLLELKEELVKKYSAQAHVLTADLSSSMGVADLLEKIKLQNIHVDVLVNNAGVGVFGDFARETEWQKEKEMIQLNITSLTELCKALLPAMIAKGDGSVLNISSTAAFQPGPNMAIYFASKAYVLHFSEALSEELRDTGVTVTVVCPGATESGFQSAAAMDNSKLFKDKNLPTSKEVAEFSYAALQNKKRVAIHGMTNFLLAQSVRFTPRIIATKIARKFQEKTH